MKLTPLKSMPKRWEKVTKHLFSEHEYWYQVLPPRETWNRDCRTLKDRGLLELPRGYRKCADDELGRGIVEARHEEWHAAAERACDEGRAAERVFPNGPQRTAYLGYAGVYVVVRDSSQLVTCFRPRDAVGHKISREEATRRADDWARDKAGMDRLERTGMRRGVNLSDLRPRVAPKEEPHAE